MSGLARCVSQFPITVANIQDDRLRRGSRQLTVLEAAGHVSWPMAIEATQHCGKSTALQHHRSPDRETGRGEEEASPKVQYVPNNLKMLHWAHFLKVLSSWQCLDRDPNLTPGVPKDIPDQPYSPWLTQCGGIR